MTARVLFKQADVSNAIKGVVKGGEKIKRIEFAPDGKIAIITESAADNDRGIGEGWEDA